MWMGFRNVRRDVKVYTYVHSVAVSCCLSLILRIVCECLRNLCCSWAAGGHPALSLPWRWRLVVRWEARTASLTVMRGFLCHTSCPWSRSAHCVGFGMETEGGEKGEVGPLIPLASFFAGTRWGNSSESLCAASSTFISGKTVQPGSKQSLPLFSVPENQKM